jgi:glycosyltransferase involved in cell wall biosynthesis
VSIIIPTHNRADLMIQAVNSALNQTYPSIEVILVDDGSTDSTPATALNFGSRIRYIRQENAGVSTARNHGFVQSQGEYVCFLDDDDVYFADKIALQVSLLKRHHDAPAANGNYFYMDQDGTLLSHNSMLPVQDTFRNLLLSDFIWMSAPLIRRDALMKTGVFNPAFSLGADIDLWLRLSQLGDFVCVQKPIGAYRIHPGSMVTKAALAEHDCIRILHSAYTHLSSSPEDQLLKKRSEAQWRIWLGTNYLINGLIQDFQRNFKQAAECAPALFADRAFITKRLSEEALSYRVSDARSFCARLFQNLPDELDFIRPYYDEIAANIDLLAAIQDATLGKRDAGQPTFVTVLEKNPALQRNPGLLRSMLIEAAMCHPTGSKAFVQGIRATVPSNNQHLLRLLEEVMHDAEVWEGFVAFQNGMYTEARSKLFAGILHRPSWLKNKGIASVFVRSMFAH